MKKIAVALAVSLLLAGCSAEFMSLLRPSPSKSYRDPDCTIAVTQPAEMFYLEAPATASVGATISIEPWVLLSAPALIPDALLPDTFALDVDPVAMRVTVTGSVSRREANPETNCQFPALYMFATPATLSLPVALPAGTWELAIASESVTTRLPDVRPDEPKTFPGPLATRSIVVE